MGLGFACGHLAVVGPHSRLELPLDQPTSTRPIHSGNAGKERVAVGWLRLVKRDGQVPAVVKQSFIEAVWQRVREKMTRHATGVG